MPEGKKAGALPLQFVRGDVTLLEVDAFVFYASHDLKLGSGFGGAIAVRGGPTIQEELDGLGPLETGQAVASGAGDLTAEHIIHAVGPRFQEEDLEEKLRQTVRSALEAAVGKGAKSIAFPPMGAGFYGIALDMCASVMIDEIEKHLAGETSIGEAVIAVQDTREIAVFEKRLGGSDR